jgi:Amt family ammonium transporter
MLIGLFGTTVFNSAGFNGLFYGGGGKLLLHQLTAVAAVTAYSLVVSYLIAKVIDLTMGLRMTEEDEETGMDLALHDESGYDFESVLGSVRNSLTGGRTPSVSPEEVSS